MQGEGRRFEPVILHEILEKVVQTFSARIFGNRQHNLEVEMRKMLKVMAAFTLLLGSQSLAHPGRTDVNGCHTNRSTGEYHCNHNSGRGSSGGSYGGGSSSGSYGGPDRENPACPLKAHWALWVKFDQCAFGHCALYDDSDAFFDCLNQECKMELEGCLDDMETNSNSGCSVIYFPTKFNYMLLMVFGLVLFRRKLILGVKKVVH